MRKKTKYLIIPLIILIFLLFFVIGLFLSERSKISDVQITNLSSNSATIVFKSDSQMKPKIWYSKDKSKNILSNLLNGEVEEDIRLKEGKKIKNEKMYQVTLNFLEPNTNYYFWIGENIHPSSNDEYQFKTFSLNEKIYTPDPFYSRVVDEKGDGVEDVFVFAYLANKNEEVSNKLSTYTNADGGWVLDMNNFKDEKGEVYDLLSKPTITIEYLLDERSYQNYFDLKDYKPLPSVILTTESGSNASQMSPLVENVVAQDCPAAGSCQFYDCYTNLVYSDNNCSRDFVPVLRDSSKNIIKSDICRVGYPSTDYCGINTVDSADGPATEPEIDKGDADQPEPAALVSDNPAQESESSNQQPASGECAPCSSGCSGLVCQECSLFNSGDNRSFCVGNKITGLDACTQNHCNSVSPGTGNSLASDLTINGDNVGEAVSEMGLEEFNDVAGFDPTSLIECLDINGNVIIRVFSFQQCPNNTSTVLNIQNAAFTGDSFDGSQLESSQIGDSGENVSITNYTTGDTYGVNETNSTQDLASNAKLAYAVYCYSNNSLPEGCMPIDQFQSQVIENSAGAAAADAYLGSQLDAHPELRGLIANDVAQRTGADISSWTPSQGLGSIPMSPENRNQFFEAVLTISENSQDFSSLIDNADAYLLDQSLTQELSGIASEYGFDLVTAKTAELNTSTYTFIVQSPDGQYWSMDIVYTNASRQVILDDARAFFASFETDKKGAYYKSFDHLVSSVKAVENLSAKEPGEYQVLGARGENISNRAIIIDRDNVEIRLFNDNNKNGVKDDDEDYLEHVKNFKISKVSDVEKLQLSSGWNSVHLYLIDEKYTKASSLLNELNDAGADIVHIAAYKSGSWSIYTQREGEDVFSNDYYIEPGTGIFIFSREISQITLSGKTYEEKVPIVLEHGWNLVGSNGLDGIDSIELFNSLKNKNIEIGVISDYDSGMYQSIVFENDQVYGNSLKLFKNKGYFISYSGKEEIIYEF